MRHVHRTLIAVFLSSFLGGSRAGAQDEDFTKAVSFIHSPTHPEIRTNPDEMNESECNE
jgi:hypothetical protein